MNVLKGVFLFFDKKIRRLTLESRPTDNILLISIIFNFFNTCRTQHQQDEVGDEAELKCDN